MLLAIFLSWAYTIPYRSMACGFGCLAHWMSPELYPGLDSRLVGKALSLGVYPRIFFRRATVPGGKGEMNIQRAQLRDGTEQNSNQNLVNRLGPRIPKGAQRMIPNGRFFS